MLRVDSDNKKYNLLHIYGQRKVYCSLTSNVIMLICSQVLVMETNCVV